MKWTSISQAKAQLCSEGQTHHCCSVAWSLPGLLGSLFRCTGFSIVTPIGKTLGYHRCFHCWLSVPLNQGKKKKSRCCSCSCWLVWKIQTKVKWVCFYSHKKTWKKPNPSLLTYSPRALEHLRQSSDLMLFVSLRAPVIRVRHTCGR